MKANRRASRTRYLRLFETIRHASLCPELGRKGRSMASLSTGLACLGRRAPTDRCVIAPDSEPTTLSIATKARWSPRQMLEQVAQLETDERSRRSLRTWRHGRP